MTMQQLGVFPTRQVDLDATTKVYHLPTWKNQDDPTRIAALREIALKGGKDPRIAKLAVDICKAAKIPPRQYKQQAEAMLAWVQGSIYYANESGERLQDPLVTLDVGHGDCDDMAILLAALYESMRLPWRYVLSGKRGNEMVRWIEGTPKKRASWSHIYVVVGWPPYVPKQWAYAEPTLQGVPLGWDVVQHHKKKKTSILPELAGPSISYGAASSLFTSLMPAAASAMASEAQEALPPIPAGPQLPFVQHVRKEVTTKLHPRNFFPIIIVGLISGFVVDRLRTGIKTLATKRSKSST